MLFPKMQKNENLKIPRCAHIEIHVSGLFWTERCEMGFEMLE